MSRITLLVIVAYLACFTVAIPSWEGFTKSSVFDSFIPGATTIEARGKTFMRKAKNPNRGPRDYLAVDDSKSRPFISSIASPPLFYLSRNKLYQYTNDTHIIPVGVVNSTLTAEAPLQLVVGSGDKSLANGKWSWYGTLLNYEAPTGQKNRGLFYSCSDKTGSPGLFLALDPVKPPKDCFAVSLHGTNKIYREDL